MCHLFFAKQGTKLPEMAHDLRVRLEYLLSREEGDILDEMAAVVDRTVDLETVLHPDDVVVIAVTRCGMNAPYLRRA
jgi:hypothetical protein